MNPWFALTAALLMSGLDPDSERARVYEPPRPPNPGSRTGATQLGRTSAEAAARIAAAEAKRARKAAKRRALADGDAGG